LVSQKHESMVIGTAPDEWFDDREQWRSAFEMEEVRLEAGDALRSCQEGSVGRVADQSTFVLPDGATIPTRLAAVMREEDGKRKLVQAHFSVGVPDEEVAI
jgi:SnoaL-like domain